MPRARKAVKKVQFRIQIEEWIKETDELIKEPIERVLLNYVDQVQESHKREEQLLKSFNAYWLDQPVRRLIDIPKYLSKEELRLNWEELKLDSLTVANFGPSMQRNKEIITDNSELTVKEYLKYIFEFERDDYEQKRKQAVKKLLQKRDEIQKPMLEKCKRFLEKKYGVKEEDMNVTLQITIKNGELKGKKFERKLSKKVEKLMIGRSEEECYKKGLSLPFDDEISSNHGFIELSTNENGKVILLYRDCGSMNGSYINGNEIEEHEYVELLNNDLLRIGATELKISRIK